MQQQSTPGVLSPPQRRMFYGWWIVIIGCLQDAVKGGLFNTGFSLYFLPVLNELHLSRAATSLPFSLAKLESALIGPIAGYLIDRFDIRVMMVLGDDRWPGWGLCSWPLPTAISPFSWCLYVSWPRAFKWASTMLPWRQ